MTPQQAEQIIIEAVKKAVPETFKLREGCKIKIKDFGIGEYSGAWINPKSPIHHENSGYYVVKHGMGWGGHYAESHCVYEYSDGEKNDNSDVEILGRPLTLADIFATIKVPLDIEFLGDGKLLLEVKTGYECQSWNLSLPLSGQRDEVKVFIAKLLQ